MPISNEEIQRRLAPYYTGAIDGKLGPATHVALFCVAAGGHLGSLGNQLGAQAAVSFPAAGITTPLRIAHFLAQASHETGGFRFLTELWGPTAAQRGYEGRGDLGNTQAGDGSRYRGRGIFQITGRGNYHSIGGDIGVNLEAQPERAAEPLIAVMTACRFWTTHNLNSIADRDDVLAITHKINGGENGLADRRVRLARIREALGC